MWLVLQQQRELEWSGAKRELFYTGSKQQTPTLTPTATATATATGRKRRSSFICFVFFLFCSCCCCRLFELRLSAQGELELGAGAKVGAGRSRRRRRSWSWSWSGGEQHSSHAGGKRNLNKLPDVLVFMLCLRITKATDDKSSYARVSGREGWGGRVVQGGRGRDK